MKTYSEIPHTHTHTCTPDNDFPPRTHQKIRLSARAGAHQAIVSWIGRGPRTGVDADGRRGKKRGVVGEEWERHS